MQWHLDAQVTARDHHHVRFQDDLVEVVESRASLDLRHQCGTVAMLGERSACAPHVFGIPNERDADELEVEFEGAGQAPVGLLQ